MTPQQTSDKKSELRKGLIALSSVTIGMGNYREVLRKYQELLLGVIDLIGEPTEENENG